MDALVQWAFNTSFVHRPGWDYDYIILCTALYCVSLFYGYLVVLGYNDQYNVFFHSSLYISIVNGNSTTSRFILTTSEWSGIYNFGIKL